MPEDEKIYRCALNMIFGFEPRIANALLDYFGCAAAIFSLSDEDLGNILGAHSKYRGRINAAAAEQAEKELSAAAREGIKFFWRGGPGYPGLLGECADAPVGLYARCGEAYAENIAGRDFISVVGTRNISDYGKEWCRRIVEALARSGRNPVIVSGLAYGTDIMAHAAALENGLDTIAVMATGADRIYPAAHRGIARKIASAGNSALVTDYPLDTRAVPINFIRRNRIIAGISRASILIESTAKGGGMITARQAFSYNRDVYVLPGRTGDPLSEGCNILLRSGTAVPVVSERDITESLGYPFRSAAGNRKRDAEYYYGKTLDDAVVDKIANILLLIKKNRHISLEDIAENTGIEYKTVAGLAGLLENDGFISIDLMQRCSIR